VSGCLVSGSGSFSSHSVPILASSSSSLSTRGFLLLVGGWNRFSWPLPPPPANLLPPTHLFFRCVYFFLHTFFSIHPHRCRSRDFNSAFNMYVNGSFLLLPHLSRHDYPVWYWRSITPFFILTLPALAHEDYPPHQYLHIAFSPQRYDMIHALTNFCSQRYLWLWHCMHFESHSQFGLRFSRISASSKGRALVGV